jgi:hypothetical protein
MLAAARQFEKRPSESEMESIVDEFNMQTIRCSMSDFK